jgi:hypothetical protein
MKKLQKILFSTLLILILCVSSYSSVQKLTEKKQNLDFENAEFFTSPLDAELLQQILAQQDLQSRGGSAIEGVNGTYELIWEPNRIQGSVHSVAVYGTILAIGAGYLYDNEVHIYRWNASDPSENGLTHMYDIGDGVFRSDILSLAFGDTDRDSYVDLVAGCADGQIYVFEQNSTSSANPLYYTFQLVWSSSRGEIGKRISSMAIDDLDSDGFYEIIVGAWSQKIYIYEYSERYGMPGTPYHRHYYLKVWDSGGAIEGLVNSVATGDTDADGFREVIAGASDNKVYIFENVMDASPEPVYPHVDNAYKEVWNSTNKIFSPIQKVAVDSQVDEDEYGEIVAISSGHGAYVLEYAPLLDEYVMSKLMRAVEPWETNPSFPIDYYVDLKVFGDTKSGVFEPGQGSGPHAPVGNITEPYSELNDNATAMAGPRDWYMWDPFYNVTLLNSTAALDGVSRVLLDFGKDEELTGGGNILPDIGIFGFEILPKNVSSENFFIYISQDGMNFSRIDEEFIIAKEIYDYHGTYIRNFTIFIDVDPTLEALSWEWFRYIKLETTTEVYMDAIGGLYLYRPVSDAVSVSIGFIPGLNTTSTDYTSKIIIGTTTGTLKAFSRISVFYVQTWDSYRPIPLYQPGTDKYRKRFSMDNNIWDISLAVPWPPLRRFIVVGTYPKVAFIEVNATTLEASSVWDTGNVLAKWTMAVDLADTDGDGTKEVVVGSFDNNIYIFDHVYCNTYRRAWRSPDLKHNQTFWDHVTDIIVEDYDSDGKLELVASTNNQTYPIIHIFENIDKNQFAPSEVIELPKDSGPITAIDLGNDLDADGAKEIVALAQKKVYTFEKKNGVITANDFTVTINGRALAVVTGDSDKDEFGEIIVGGYDEIILGYTIIRYGFVSIYENYGNATIPHGDNKYQNVWNAPSEHVIKGESFTVRSLALDDQDEDDKTEIIVGHDLGINIYENIGNNNFEISHIITSSASYPYYTPAQLVALHDNYCPGPFNSWEGWEFSSAPVVQLSNGTYVMVFTALDTSLPSGLLQNQSRLFFGTSSDGISWTLPRRITNDSWYNPTADYYLYYERNPHVIVTSYDEVWIAYEAKFVVRIGEFLEVEKNLWTCVTKLGTARPDLDLSKVFYPSVSPSLFWNSTSLTLGLTFLNYTGPSSVEGKMLYLCKSHWGIIIGGTPPRILYTYPIWETPQLQECKIGTEFIAFSQETVFLSDASLAVVFDGYNKSAYRDTDIWFITANTSIASGWNDPRLMSVPEKWEYAPSIAVLKGDILVVAWRILISKELILHSHVYITASVDNGWSWTTPQELPEPTSGEPYAPSISGLTYGGFMYTFHTGTDVIFPPISPKIYFAKNPVENWWLYTIGQVQCLAVGDTDNNQKNEIVAGSLNQIYVLELTNIGDGKINYTEKWASQVLPQLITDIAVGDINNDGAQEIVAAAESGNLYAFKWKKLE